MHQDFNLIHYTKIVPKEAVFRFYEPVKVEGYCKSCPNYNKLWSCPPHDFSATSYLDSYNYVLLVGSKIIRNEKSQAKTTMNTYFQEVRRNLGNQLIELSETQEVQVLIAGNCYLCENCLRTEGKSCRYDDHMKYSLESIGFLVSDIASELLGIDLEWPEPGKEFPSLMTVGAIFAKEENTLEAMLNQWR